MGKSNNIPIGGYGNLTINNNTINNTNISQIISNFEVVSTIPSYIRVDNLSVKDNGDGTYNIYEIEGNSISSKLFNIVADLRYENITLDGTNTILGNFTQVDIGKTICIKKANKNNASGTNQAPKTQLGRIVTVTAKIITVVDNTSATIDFTPNQTGVKRCYVATNNYQQIQQAVNFCLWRGVSNLEITEPYDSIIGFNPHDRGLYNDFTSFVRFPSIQIRSSVGSLSITSPNKAVFKLMVENVNSDNYSNAWEIDGGNGDFKMLVNNLPPDEAHFDYFLGTPSIIEYGTTTATNAVRTLGLYGQYDRPELCDNNDAWWSSFMRGSRGGINNADASLIKYQVIELEDIYLDTKMEGLTCFSNGQATVKQHCKNIHIPFRWNYEGENGRAFAANRYEFTSIWEFNFDVVVSGGGTLITVADIEDFSFKDYPQGGRFFKIYIGGTLISNGTINGGQSAQMDNPTNSDIKSIGVQPGLVDGTYTGFWIKYDNPLGHPGYTHPNVAFILDNVSFTNDIWRYYSSGGQAGTALYSIIKNGCNLPYLELRNSDQTSTTGVVEIYDSYVFGGNATMDFVAKNSTIVGTWTIDNATSLGGNKLGGFELYVQTEFSSNNDELIGGSINMKQSGSKVTLINSKINGASFPIIDDGEIHIYNNDKSSKQWFKESVYTPTNCKVFLRDLDCFDEQTLSLGQFNKGLSTFTLEAENVRIANPGNRINIGLVDFDKNNINNGVFPVNLDNYRYINVVDDNNLSGQPFYMSQQGDYSIGNCNVVQYNKFKLTPAKTYNIFNADFRTNSNAFWLTSSLWNLPYFSGEITILYDGTNSTSLYHKPSNVNAIRTNSTISNIVNKNLDRIEGEIVRYRVDSRNNRIVEIESSVKKHFTSSKPTRKGIHREELFLDENVYFEYDIQYTVLDGVSSTETIVQENLLNSSGSTVSHDVISSGKYFSIKQEIPEGTDLTSFSFTLIDDLNIEHNFTYVTINNQVNYNKHFWAFTDGVTQCYIENEIGKIIFITSVPFTLRATNNFRVDTGFEIISGNWYRKSTSEIEILTTVVRNSILNDVKDGYEVYDSDLSQKFIKISNAWV